MILLGLYRIAKAMSDSEAFASSSISYRQSSDIVGRHDMASGLYLITKLKGKGKSEE